MAKESKKVNPLSDEISCYLTDDERKHLVTSLNDALAWVGVQPPDEFKIDSELLKKEVSKLNLNESLQSELHVDKGVIDLRNLIWRLVNEKELTEKEEIEIKDLVNFLRIKEHQNEDTLKEVNLTCQQAKQLYGETESIIRSLLDLKEILSHKKTSEYEQGEVIKKKVDDIKRWSHYVKKQD
jgi:argonaute-like protein implicated in RNA metabolism and viral defense